ncbi:hypothetical protein Lesp02_70820 [Lentzea sp. NBRC 105346]|uniref:minor capsid protein n=1 Tax=Lentzea sp. NBRC 105346 TaxID=3032205 RepID=UPI0024A57827|nr:minor capsid protein [Lentzea sp. NBRC 105346]GLZ34895.1 hypothetical protein Lesp02_70820 [Lentzea sp. NBRC 105346]
MADKDFLVLLDEIEENADDAAEAAVRDVTEEALADTRKVVPYQEGDLSRAGHTTVNQIGSGAEGKIDFDIVYARYQELREDLTHQDQGQAHYLGGTLRLNSERYLDHLGARFFEELG